MGTDQQQEPGTWLQEEGGHTAEGPGHAGSIRLSGVFLVLIKNAETQVPFTVLVRPLGLGCPGKDRGGHMSLYMCPNHIMYKI